MIRLAVGVFFITLPFLEVILLVKLWSSLGFLATLGLMILAGAVGAAVIAQQSGGAFRQALEAAGRGETPHAAVLDGMFLMLAGVFLLIPGLITDAMGLLLLVPPVRHWVARRTFESILRNAAFDAGNASEAPRDGHPRDPFGGAHRAPPGKGPVIEGEFQRLDEQPPRRNDNPAAH
jgi:UPF0716 protein FxsA